MSAMHIAGWKTPDDWRALRAKLVLGCEPTSWQQVFCDFFYQRLKLRYLDPIAVLQEHGTFQGEGFSIVAIQCTLIEFLESTAKGLNYRYVRRGEQLGPYEYSKSGELFVSFLCNRSPFAGQFTEPLAQDFYEGVRCALLHEARTKNGWTIWAESADDIIVDGTTKTLYRNNFQAALLKFIDWYKEALVSDPRLQEAIIRKFDSLCE